MASFQQHWVWFVLTFKPPLLFMLLHLSDSLLDFLLLPFRARVITLGPPGKSRIISLFHSQLNSNLNPTSNIASQQNLGYWLNNQGTGICSGEGCIFRILPTIMTDMLSKGCWCTLKKKKSFCFWKEVSERESRDQLDQLFPPIKKQFQSLGEIGKKSKPQDFWLFSSSGLALNLSSGCGANTPRKVGRFPKSENISNMT